MFDPISLTVIHFMILYLFKFMYSRTNQESGKEGLHDNTPVGGLGKSCEQVT